MLTVSAMQISCGLQQLGGEVHYKTAETYFKDLMTRIPQGSLYTLYIWSHQPEKYTIGHDMVAYIEKHKLGTVTVSPVGNNPVHNSKICVWTWIRDVEAFERHRLELFPPEEAPCPPLIVPPIAAPSS